MSTLIFEFCDLLNNERFVGDVVEFGTGPGSSAEFLGNNLKNKKITTFDGFVGLPETQKGIPLNSEWYQGNYCYDYNTIKNKLSSLNNVTVIKRMSHELTTPSYFNIFKIAGVNLDFDLYEGTLDGLNFIEKGIWNNILLRFDDWGCHPNQISEEIDRHEKMAFYDWIKKTKYEYNEFIDLTNKSYGMQTIIEVKR